MALLTISESAKRLNITERTLRKWLREGVLPGVKMGRIWRVDDQDLEEFIHQSKKKGQTKED